MHRMKILINILLIIICLYNSGMIIYKKIKPDFPIIQVYKKSLNETEFPLIFHICLNEIKTEEDKNIYQSFGYNSVFEWFVGKSMYNDYNYGWLEATSSVKEIKNKRTICFIDFAISLENERKTYIDKTGSWQY